MSNLSDVMTLPLQIPETIPNDWSWRNLVELCNPKQWKTISNSDLTETGYRVFGANGFIGFYHEFNHEGEVYRLHQTQYYNSNFKDKDPDFNPGVTELALSKISDTGEIASRIGTILVKTDEYLKDLKNLNITKRVS